MNKLPRHPATGQQGVALIEVLVAILIFSIGVLGLIGLQSRAIALSIDAEDRNRASMLANELVSTLWLRGAAGLSAADEEAWKERLADVQESGLPDADAEITTTTLTGGRRQIDVTILWKPPGRKDADPQSRLTTTVVLP